MLPNYTIYTADKDLQSYIKKGQQLIHVYCSVRHVDTVYVAGWGMLAKSDYLHHKVNLTPIAMKGNSLPISQLHPSILEFYEEQIGLGRYHTTKDIQEVKDLFGDQYLSQVLSKTASTLQSLSEVLSSTYIIPTIVGKKWSDFIIALGNVNQLGMIPAVIEELSKVTLNELPNINALEVSIKGFYKIHFDILTVVGRVVVLEITSIEVN